MKYHNITKEDMLNGDGLRAVLWLSGCSHGCYLCQNPVTWDAKCGLEFNEEAKEELLHELEKPYISGVTLSGGDPLFLGNREEVGRLLHELKERFPDKTIWLYTGYTWEEIHTLFFLSLVDVLVDGKFIFEQKNEQLHWRGSANQRVIDVPASLAENKVVLHCE